MDPENPFSLKDVIDGWVKCGLKAIEPDSFHAFYSPEELWKYREYTWSAETASHEDVRGTDDEMYPDKWRFLPDEEENTGLNKWNKMVEKMRSVGWNPRQPAYFEIGKNGVAKVGEGNHRLAIAKELGVRVPVVFSFKNSVTMSPASNVR